MDNARIKELLEAYDEMEAQDTTNFTNDERYAFDDGLIDLLRELVWEIRAEDANG